MPYQKWTHLRAGLVMEFSSAQDTLCIMEETKIDGLLA
jgi:hypothetical protein